MDLTTHSWLQYGYLCLISIFSSGGAPHPTNQSWRLVWSLDLTTLNWTQLPDLPSDAHTGTFVWDGDDLVLVNPYKANLMRFDPEDSTFEVVSGLNTTTRGYFTSVTAINEDMLSGC